MSATTYDGLGTTLTVRASGSTINVGFTTSIAIVGGYDAANAAESVTANEAEYVSSGDEAATLFGEGSELHKATNLAYTNRAGDVYCIPVAETTGVTETFGGTSSGTLSDVPFDPNVNTEHDITVTDVVEGTDVAVNIVYDETPSAPSNANTINLNPANKQWVADESSDYEITYDYGDYSGAITEAVGENVRYVVCLTENESIANDLLSTLNSHAKDFEFKRGVVGTRPEIADPTNFEYGVDDQRLIAVSTPRVFNDGEVRLAAGIGGAASTQPLGSSLTYDSINGFTSLRTEFRPSEAESFDRVTTVADTNEVVEAVTTSSVDKFSDIFKAEIVDATAEGLHEVAKQYRAGPNTEDDQQNLRSDMIGILSDFASRSPPLLYAADGGRAYSITVDYGASADITDVTVGVELLNVMKEINLNLNVGSVVTYEGAS
jgi:hypothetical protein